MDKKNEITALYLQHKYLQELDARHLTPAGVAYVQSVWDGMLEAFEAHGGGPEEAANARLETIINQKEKSQ